MLLVSWYFQSYLIFVNFGTPLQNLGLKVLKVHKKVQKFATKQPKLTWKKYTSDLYQLWAALFQAWLVDNADCRVSGKSVSSGKSEPDWDANAIGSQTNFIIIVSTFFCNRQESWLLCKFFAAWKRDQTRPSLADQTDWLSHSFEPPKRSHSSNQVEEPTLLLNKRCYELIQFGVNATLRWYSISLNVYICELLIHAWPSYLTRLEWPPENMELSSFLIQWHQCSPAFIVLCDGFQIISSK